MTHAPDGDDGDIPPIAVVADDSEALVDTMKAALEAVGVHTVGVHSAEALEEHVRATTRSGDRPAVVVTDVYMHGATGLDVSARLLRDMPDLPIVIVSAFASDQMRARAARIGVRRVLSKPVGMRELQQVVLAELE